MSSFQIYDQFNLALYEQEYAGKLAKNEFNSSYLLAPLPNFDGSECPAFLPCSLAEIYEFDKEVQMLSISAGRRSIIFYCAPKSISVTRGAFLIGSHLIMSHDFLPDELYAAFKPIHKMLHCSNFGPHLSLESCWRALYMAKCHGWVDFRNRFRAESEVADDEPLIEEYLHYAR